MIAPGQVLDKYQLLERVGQGGMSVVYRALDRSLQRVVAVKVLHRHLADSDEARARFEREAHAVAKLRHENILEIYAYSGAASEESYIVTEFIDGSTLKQFVTDHPIAHPEVAAMIALQICRALVHAHGAGILHRDVKPENVMIRSDGVAKLMDFGISHMVDLGRLTVTGQLMGSPAYMSPEHVEGQPLDYRTDIFAAGVVLYHLAVGRLPFDGKNPHEVLKRVAECRFVDPRQANPRVGNELGKIILRAMARAPADRYQHIAEMAGALETYLRDSGVSHPREELAGYFSDPEGYQSALAQRLVDHLSERGLAALADERVAALEAFDRVLTIDSKNPRVLSALDRLERRRRLGRGIAAVTAIALLGVGAATVRRRQGTADPLEAKSADAAAARIAGDADVAGHIAATMDARHAETLAAAHDASTRDDRDRPNSIAVDARAAAAGTDASTPGLTTRVSLLVTPSNSSVQLGSTAPRVLPSGRGEVEVPAGGIEVTVTNDECCEAKRVRISPDDSRRPVVITLPFRPGQVTTRCAVPGVQVRVDGRSREPNAAATIPFGDTTQSRRSVSVEFVAGGKIDRKSVTAIAGGTVEVTCDL